MDTFLVRSALKKVLGTQWKLLGLNLLISWIKLDNIDNEASFPDGIAKKEEVIQLWMSQEPTWIVLVDALSQPSIGLSQKASQISREHSKYLTIIIPHSQAKFSLLYRMFSFNQQKFGVETRLSYKHNYAYTASSCVNCIYK